VSDGADQGEGLGPDDVAGSGGGEPGDDESPAREPAAGDDGEAAGDESAAREPAAGDDGEAAGDESAAREPAADGAGNNGKDSGSGGGGAGAAASEGPAELLGQVRAIRRRARLARHAYWFPLVLFGLLTCASVPFYIPRSPARGYATYTRVPGPAFLQSGYLGGFGIWSDRGTAYYWLGAMLLGIAATVLWYRWRGNRVGLRTPARGYLITGLIIVALALLIPLVGRGGGVGMLPIMPGDLVVRGTFPFVLVGLGLCFLAWAERSVGLTVIAIVYLALALLASLYDIQNVFYNWFGWTPSLTAGSLPNVLLPALVLLLSGAGAWVVQRRQRAPAPEES
jgi:hypothetical protein